MFFYFVAMSKNKKPEVTTGQEVRTARLRAGHTQQHIADVVGVSVVTISRIENNHHSPRVALLKRVMAACSR